VYKYTFFSIIAISALLTGSFAFEQRIFAAGITQLRPPSSFVNPTPNAAKPHLNQTLTLPKETGSASPNILGLASNTTASDNISSASTPELKRGLAMVGHF